MRPTVVRHHWPVGLPSVVVFRAECGPDSPFWTEDGVGLDYSTFRALPAGLVQELTLWCEAAWDLEDDSPEAQTWDAEGKRLFGKVERYLPPGVELRWDSDV